MNLYSDRAQSKWKTKRVTFGFDGPFMNATARTEMGTSRSMK